MPEVIKEWWGVLTGVVLLIVWLVRLEGRAIANSKNNLENSEEIIRMEGRFTRSLDALEARRKEDQEFAREQREVTNKMLAEIRQDVKALLSGSTK